MTKYFRGLLASVMLAGLTAAAQAQTTITFRFNDPEAPQMRQALDEFEKANPDIKVTMQRVSWGDAQQQFLREAAVGSAPDVAQIAFVWPRAFAAAGALRPLDDLIAKTGIGVAGWDQFVSRDLAMGADGKPYAIPFTTDTFAMIYNKDLLKAAGYDKLPTTWDDLRESQPGGQGQDRQGRLGLPGRNVRNADDLVPHQLLHLVERLGFRRPAAERRQVFRQHHA